MANNSLAIQITCDRLTEDLFSIQLFLKGCASFLCDETSFLKSHPEVQNNCSAREVAVLPSSENSPAVEMWRPWKAPASMENSLFSCSILKKRVSLGLRSEGLECGLSF